MTIENFDNKGLKQALDEFTQATQLFAEAAAKAFIPLAEGINRAFHNIPAEAYHKLGMRHPREIVEDYYRYTAEPDAVVEHIVNSPRHTWNGVTIYPDEAWRFMGNADWMWWR